MLISDYIFHKMTPKNAPNSPFVLLILLDGGHPLPRLLVHVVVGVYPHLVLDVAHVLQLLALVLLDALHRAAALDVRDREAELLHIVTIAGGKRQVALPVGELDGGIECGAEFELRGEREESWTEILVQCGGSLRNYYLVGTMFK